MSDRRPLVELRNISKRFPGVKALDGVSLSFFAGEVHSLMGENGAGKSTLMKIISGAQPPDEGEIIVAGRSVRIRSPIHARELGIGMVYQELTVLDNVDVARNLLLGREPLRGPHLIDRQSLYRRAGEIIDDLSLDLDPRAMVGDLTIGRKQMVEIARIVAANPRLIIMDEPTSSLGRREEELLFALIHRLRDRGVAIAYVSHRMAEVFALSDRVSVLRDGLHIFTETTQRIDRDGVVKAMVGRFVDETYGRRERSSERSTEGHRGVPPRLELTGVSLGTTFSNVAFSVAPGEILGVGGLIGSGRTAVAETIFGLRKPDSGEIRIDGAPIELGDVAAAMAAGVAYVPDDRKGLGLILAQSVRFNMSITVLRVISRLGLRRDRAETTLYDRWRDRLSIRAASAEQIVSTLSGGNQQKVVLAKWLARDPRLLILNEPTRGVDVGAKADVHAIVRRIADSGVAVVMISSELPELLAVSDRIMVMWQGSITGVVPADEATEERIIALAFGDTGEVA